MYFSLEHEDSKTPRDADTSKTKGAMSTDTDEDISEHFSEPGLEIESSDNSEREDSPKLLVLDTTPLDKDDSKGKLNFFMERVEILIHVMRFIYSAKVISGEYFTEKWALQHLANLLMISWLFYLEFQT